MTLHFIEPQVLQDPKPKVRCGALARDNYTHHALNASCPKCVKALVIDLELKLRILGMEKSPEKSTLQKS